MLKKVWLEAGEDYSASKEVRKTVFVDEQKYPLTEEFDGHDKTCPHLVIFDGEKPVATGRIFLIENNTAKLGRIAVLKEYRGKHLGAEVMRALIERAREMNASSVYISAQTYAIPFYEKFGLKAYGEEYLDIHIPHRDMKMDL